MAYKRLPPDVNRILYIRNLPYKTDNTSLYDLFGRYGAVRQIRLGTGKSTRGTAYVVYEDIYDAKSACEALSGFNYGGRYLIVLYYTPTRTYPVSAPAVAVVGAATALDDDDDAVGVTAAFCE